MMSTMRTTLTIDDHLARRLKDRAYEQRKPFKEVVNETLERGLAAPARTPHRPIRIKTRKLVYRSGIDEMKIKDHLDELQVAEDGPV